MVPTRIWLNGAPLTPTTTIRRAHSLRQLARAPLIRLKRLEINSRLRGCNEAAAKLPRPPARPPWGGTSRSRGGKGAVVPCGALPGWAYLSRRIMTGRLPESLNRRAVPERVGYSHLLTRRGPIYSRLKSVVGLVAVLLIALVASPHAPRGGLVFLELVTCTSCGRFQRSESFRWA